MAPDILRKGAGWKKWAIFVGSLLLAGIQVKIYFLRELLVAELLLLLAFGLMGILCGFCLLLGTLGERGGLLIKEGTQAVFKTCVVGAADTATRKQNQAALSSFFD